MIPSPDHRLPELSAEESEKRIGRSRVRKAPGEFITAGRAHHMSDIVPSFPANETVHRVQNAGVGDDDLMGNCRSSPCWRLSLLTRRMDFGIARRL